MITNNALIAEMVLVYYFVEDLNGPSYRIGLVGEVEDIDGFRREFLVFLVLERRDSFSISSITLG
jgi:hypothetical protein